MLQKGKLERLNLRIDKVKLVQRACRIMMMLLCRIYFREAHSHHTCWETRKRILERRFECESTSWNTGVVQHNDLCGIIRNLDFFARRCVWKKISINVINVSIIIISLE
jgi:hypothetical protein